MRAWLADLLMLSGACAVVVGSPFGLAWYLTSPLIYIGIVAALLGLAVAPSRWRAGVFVGIAMSWMQAGLVILIAIGAARFVWPRLRLTAHPVADPLALVAGGCVLIGWYGGWTAPPAIGAVAALASLSLDRRNRWRAGLFAAVLTIAAAPLVVR
jgi:hypothetical protein